MNKSSKWRGTTAGFSTNRRPGEENDPWRTPVPALTVIAHPNVSRIGDCAVLHELDKNRMLHLARDRPDFAPPGKVWGEPLDDPFLSRNPILLRRAPDGDLELDPRKSRTFLSVGGERIDEIRRVSADELEEGVVLDLAGRIVLLLHYCQTDRVTAGPDLGLIGNSDAVISLRGEISRVADLDVPVLLRGASGTGKELVARGIHEAGPRRAKPFVAVNLGAIPGSLAASELFGSTRGAFTGAVRDQAGFFQAARGGTLFLDEIGEAPQEVQVMLLRALETGEISPVGAQSATRVNVRIVAATDADLEELVRKESFKSPLLHRLAGYSILLAPLTKRREDIGRLLIYFAKRELARIGESHRLVLKHPKDLPWLPTDLAVLLAAHPWPGNVRQLRNVVQQLIIASRGGEPIRLTPAVSQILGPGMEPARRVDLSTGKSILTRRRPVRKPSTVTEEELLAAMRANLWNYKAVAKALRISRSSLYTLVESCPSIRTIDEVGAEEIRVCRDRLNGDLVAMADHLHVSARALQRKIKEIDSGT